MRVSLGLPEPPAWLQGWVIVLGGILTLLLTGVLVLFAISIPSTRTPTLPPALTTTNPPPTPRSLSTYSETVWPQGGVGTFKNHHNASGVGPTIGANQTVQVSCKIYDPAIVSVKPEGYWYRIASSPWNDAFYSPTNVFLNGDPTNGPYSRPTDWSVPNC